MSRAEITTPEALADESVVELSLRPQRLVEFIGQQKVKDSLGIAIAAARAMETALAGLNSELAAEGRPPLAIGVGINTARVVAGNIGSHRRLNYSVIGDGVNVAARLQALTRVPDHRTNIILSAATRAAGPDRTGP
mgnify:CR=1 FL=1